MLFYIKCVTCSRILSRNLDKYSADLKAVIDNPNTTDDEKNIESAALLDKYGYKKICCRMRIMGLLPYHEIIVT